MSNLGALGAGSEAQDQSGPGPMGPVDHGEVLKGAQSQLEESQARYGKLNLAKSLLGKVRAEMDGLAKLGDTVQHEDVIKAAGALVGAGLSPEAMAAMLADMPQEGEALQAWVASHDQDVRAREAQLKEVMGLYRHKMGVDALSVLAGHHTAPGAQEAPSTEPEAGPGNGLMPGANAPPTGPETGMQGSGPAPNPLTDISGNHGNGV